ncbi:MAG: flagellar biosynthetic protein FliO [Candidatus Eremiobacteraeota bacterium]|nr:flagellar biosynthetic protein FliO [Candidatus Eremiobacteraeota bacterium]
MGADFIGRYILALVVVALLLVGLYSIVRALGRGRILASADKRLVSVIESTFISQNTTLHVVKIGDKYYAVAGGSGHLSLLCEVPTDEVAPWLDSQRRLLSGQTQSLAGFLKYLRRPPQ